MTNRTKVIIAVVLLTAVFAAGRLSAHTKIKIEKEIVEVEKKSSESDKDSHKKTTIVDIELPDGTKKRTTVVENDTHQETKDSSSVSLAEKDSKEIVKDSGKLNISALGGVSSITSTPLPVYGLAVSKPVLGPITLGIWGLSNLTVGVSLGLEL